MCHVIDIQDKAKVKVKTTRWVEEFENYKTLRNKATYITMDLNTAYYTNVILDNLAKPNKLWKAIKQILQSSASAQTVR